MPLQPHAPRDGVTGSKAALRARLLERRRALRLADLVEAAEELAEVLLADERVARAGRVAAYVSVGAEPGTGPLLGVLHERGTTVLLPLLLPGNDLAWAPYAGAQALRRAPLGLLEPTTSEVGADELARTDVVLVPALAVDRRGTRLGRGGGSYDRALPGTGTAWRVALLHRGELLDLRLPREPHDLPVDAAATPDGLVDLR